DVRDHAAPRHGSARARSRAKCAGEPTRGKLCTAGTTGPAPPGKPARRPGRAPRPRGGAPRGLRLGRPPERSGPHPRRASDGAAPRGGQPMRRALAVAVAVALAAGVARGEDRPAALRDVAFMQRLGESVPLDVPFRDEAGRTVTLRDYTGKPVLLVPAYYTCPMLCTLVLNGVVSALRALPFDVGDELTVVTFSFDPRDDAETAARKKATYLAEYRRPGAEAGWHFLTGDPTSIGALTDAIGFHATWDEANRQYAHASGIVLLTPEGRITRYFFGV